ncbi:unnamed protein product [Calypogeia fissa]
MAILRAKEFVQSSYHKNEYCLRYGEVIIGTKTIKFFGKNSNMAKNFSPQSNRKYKNRDRWWLLEHSHTDTGIASLQVP